MDSNEHRTFILMLDADEGQELAVSEGFTPPSEEVQTRENHQVLKHWALMEAEGVLPKLLNYAEWFAGLVVPDDATEEERTTTVHSFVTFAAASISTLKTLDLIETPINNRLLPILHDTDGKVIDDDIPEELLEHAAEMYEWQNRNEQ